MRIASLPRGIYLAKDVKRTSRRIFSILKDLGHQIVAWEEEASAVYSDSHYWATRIDAPTRRMIDAQLAWGEWEADVLDRYADTHHAPIHVTGNPRIDLMRPELRGYYADAADALRERFGKFLLLNTNFGIVNPFYPSLRKHTAAARLRVDPNATFQVEELLQSRTSMLQKTLELVPVLARAFPERQLVVRPHPGENQDVWRRAAEGCANVTVVFEGSVLPWLLASEALVHNGCTTAIEARVMEIPAIAYCPLEDAQDHNLPNQLSKVVHTEPQLLELLAAVLEGKESADPGPEANALLHHHLAALDGPLAAERIVDAIEAVCERTGGPREPSLGKALAARAHAATRAAWRHAVGRLPGNKHSRAYTKHRFPGLETAEVEAVVARLGAQLGRFESVEVRELFGDVFEIRT
jgi:surface carbohydrate biosynthesis protein